MLTKTISLTSLTDYSSAIQIAREAGECILRYYSSPIKVHYKDDHSPVTLADQVANDIILTQLKTAYPTIPCLSEESALPPAGSLLNDYWLIDPLDGTKEFLKRTDEFTVNIAFISNQQPMFGIVYAPAKKLLYYGGPFTRSYKVFLHEEATPLSNAESFLRNEIIFATSRSHQGDEAHYQTFFQKKLGKPIKNFYMGSSLKICAIAEQTADFYLRLGATMGWDIAAGHAILKGVGGAIVNINDQQELTYSTKSLLNPAFIAYRKNPLKAFHLSIAELLAPS